MASCRLYSFSRRIDVDIFAQDVPLFDHLQQKEKDEIQKYS